MVTGMDRAGFRKSLRILFVDDHEDTRMSFRALFSSMGHQIVTAANLREGKALLRSSSFDLVFSDIGLPDGSGWDLLEGLELDPAVITVAMSGYGMAEDHIKSRKAGFQHHLTKPPHTEEVIAILKEAEAR
jgi:CheY-like chemotaxis protein